MDKYIKYILILLFLLGFIFIIKTPIKEGLSNIDRCPNILIQKGKDFYLYNSKLEKVPGVNPVHFNSLDDYTEFIEWQRSQGIRCPILYLQQTYDIQGNMAYAIRPSPNNLQGGLPHEIDNYVKDINKDINIQKTELPETLLTDASRDDPPYNTNYYPSFDPKNQNIGSNTPLDKLYNENPKGISPNPMDPNWGGNDYTLKLINSGYYDDNNVQIYVP
jgi:hypothetical protein